MSICIFIGQGDGFIVNKFADLEVRISQLFWEKYLPRKHGYYISLILIFASCLENIKMMVLIAIYDFSINYKSSF